MADNKGMSKIKNEFSTIVITAQTFNPSIFTETWLIKNDIIHEKAFEGTRVFSPEVAQFQTSELQVLVIPPKMQIVFSVREGDSDAELPKKIAIRTVELLPQTSYQALGLNFDFLVAHTSGQDFNSYNRDLLGNGNNNLLQEFSVPDAKFGRYFSKNYGEGRLKLDIKPVKVGPENEDQTRFSFNFHCEVFQFDSQNRVGKLVSLIEQWDSLYKYAQQLVGLGTKI